MISPPATAGAAAPTARLGLGVAQFGLDGRVGARGRPPEAEVRDMLALAGRSGLKLLDTAAASTHGEGVLGAALPRPASARVLIKAPRGDRGGGYVRAEVRATLGRLNLPRAEAVIVQSAGDLFAPHGPEWWAGLKALRDEGLVARVGISAYVSDDPAGLARRFQPDILQAPASLLDQRLLLDGSLERVRERGVEVHLRSIFLNGLLFLPPDRAPSQIGDAAIARLARARRLIVEGRSDPLRAALGFALSRPEVDAVIVGAATVAELSAVIAAARHPPPDLDWDDMALDNPEAADPRRWAAA